MTTKELENYEPKGHLEGFPKEIIARMLDYQEEQGNKEDISVFEKQCDAAKQCNKGFEWDDTKEGWDFWHDVITNKNFNLFFEKYPKQDNQDNSQEFRVGEEFDLESYTPKGDLKGFPKEIIARMLDCQEEQGNKRDISVFEEDRFSLLVEGGFEWDKTKEGYDFWYKVILKKDFDLFFEKYPKKEDNQEFRVGDEVVDIIMGRRGKITYIETPNKDSYPIFVNFDDNETACFTLDGRYYSFDKHPRLLHYRDDYDYSVIDFNNLPKRQEPKRWRAEKEGIYYFIKRDAYHSKFDRVCETKDYYSYISNEQYKIGNYFQTKEQAQEVANKLKEYFNQLINPNK